MQDFANMSAALTGFQSSFIRPFLDPVNLSGTFYQFAVSQVGQPRMDALLSAFDALSNQTPKLTPQQIADKLLEISAPSSVAQAQLCQSHRGDVVPGIVVSARPFQTDGFAPPASHLCAGVHEESGLEPRAVASDGIQRLHVRLLEPAPASLETFGVNTGNGGGQ